MDSFSADELVETYVNASKEYFKQEHKEGATFKVLHESR